MTSKRKDLSPAAAAVASAALQTPQAALALAARSLPEPQGYYQGHHAPSAVLPSNVLAFHRTSLLKGASCHSRHVLVINVEPHGLLAVDGVVMDMPPASAALVSPYQHHHYPNPTHTTHANAPCRLFLTFDLPEAVTLSPLRHRVMVLSPLAMQHAIRLCEIYPQQDTHPPVWVQNELVLHLAYLIQSMLTQVATAPTSTHVASTAGSVNVESRQLVRAVGKYLKENESEPVTIQSLAEALAISPSHLRHLFKHELRISLGQYIRLSKSIHAAALIDTTSKSLGQIATACGYSTLSAFSRSFTREMGLSPSQYRHRLETAVAQ